MCSDSSIGDDKYNNDVGLMLPEVTVNREHVLETFQWQSSTQYSRKTYILG